MTLPTSPVLVIPARLGSTRLPRKVLADLHGDPMIVHVWRRAAEAELGEVVVACDAPEIAEAVERVGGTAVLTDARHPSGSDRIHEAVNALDAGRRRFDCVINIQGDIPTLPPAMIRTVHGLLDDPEIDIATVAGVIDDTAEAARPSVVKAVVELEEGGRRGRALYFSRAPVPHGPGPWLHHVGIYAYRREALDWFIGRAPTELERREQLEQLRALAAGMVIGVGLVDEVPLGVDTEADLERVRRTMAAARGGVAAAARRLDQSAA